jgi:carbonic anhydrase/acetyltransferase-like protein (isoleucine patch superfamily)
MPLYAWDGHEPELPGDGSAFVADTAVLIGRVRLKAGASVWFGAVLRGDNDWLEVGEGSNIQDGCLLHADEGVPTIVGPGCTIGHHVVLHGCTLGCHVLVGMGALVMNHAVIGDNSIVGAGALVTERKVFPERSLIMGSPARLIRELDAATIATLPDGAAHYRAKAAAWPTKARQLPR